MYLCAYVCVFISMDINFFFSLIIEHLCVISFVDYLVADGDKKKSQNFYTHSPTHTN